MFPVLSRIVKHWLILFSSCESLDCLIKCIIPLGNSSFFSLSFLSLSLINLSPLRVPLRISHINQPLHWLSSFILFSHSFPLSLSLALIPIHPATSLIYSFHYSSSLPYRSLRLSLPPSFPLSLPLSQSDHLRWVHLLSFFSYFFLFCHPSRFLYETLPLALMSIPITYPTMKRGSTSMLIHRGWIRNRRKFRRWDLLSVFDCVVMTPS